MTRPDLVDAHGDLWTWVECYVDDDGNMRSLESLEGDDELSPLTEVAED